METMAMFPVGPMGYRMITITNNEGTVLAFHHVPTEQFGHLLDQQGACLCGPLVDTEFDLENEVLVPHIGHWALDPKYYEELHWDWGPDGPAPSYV